VGKKKEGRRKKEEGGRRKEEEGIPADKRRSITDSPIDYQSSVEATL
jgi:hypothetical protein